MPPHYHREMQKRFRTFFQGQMSVEEYFDEFKFLRNILELYKTEESLMAQFVDGLQECISRKVERQPYHDLGELLHLATQVECQIKKKRSTVQRGPNHHIMDSTTSTTDLRQG